jgi:hypothetical protein
VGDLLVRLVVQRRAVIAGEGVDLAEGVGGGEDIRRDDLVQQAGELAISEADAVEGLEPLTEVRLQGSAVTKVLAEGVFEAAELFNEPVLEALLVENEVLGCWGRVGAVRGRHGGISRCHLCRSRRGLSKCFS